MVKQKLQSSNIDVVTNEVVKLNAGEYSGYFTVEAVTNNSFVIDRKYITSPSTNPEMFYYPKVKITVPHGILGYKGKKIAVVI